MLLYFPSAARKENCSLQLSVFATFPRGPIVLFVCFECAHLISNNQTDGSWRLWSGELMFQDIQQVNDAVIHIITSNCRQENPLRGALSWTALLLEVEGDWKEPTVAEHQEHEGPVPQQPHQRSSVWNPLRQDVFGLRLSGRGGWFVLKYWKDKHSSRWRNRPPDFLQHHSEWTDHPSPLWLPVRLTHNHED